MITKMIFNSLPIIHSNQLIFLMSQYRITKIILKQSSFKNQLLSIFTYIAHLITHTIRLRPDPNPN